MIINKLQAQELIKYFNNQFIDRNDEVLYDGEILNQFLRELTDWVESQNNTCDHRHKNGYWICTLSKNHDSEFHSMYLHDNLVAQWKL